ncbi:hypothetical protein [Mesotoga sp. UBA6090]|uniref:hypothetical protein n=1 Tax=Mesotoga sp. UBA6090 TaxID=1946860 RepID=UPI0025F538A8|nr:hypothetical protein [Mesotoga sp. UBA6090]
MRRRELIIVAVSICHPQKEPRVEVILPPAGSEARWREEVMLALTRQEAFQVLGLPRK